MLQGNKSGNHLANIGTVLPAIRLLYAIHKTQPRKPVVGVCLEGDTTLRLMATVALYQAGRINRVIVSGGFEEDNKSDQRPAARMKEFLLTKGLPEEIIYLEEKSRSTHDHPLFVNTIAKSQGFTDLMIITSGYHLLRAYLRFLKTVIVEDYPFILYGYPAGSIWSWLQKTPTGGNYRILNLFGEELTKIRTYHGLASSNEAWEYIHALNIRKRFNRY